MDNMDTWAMLAVLGLLKLLQLLSGANVILEVDITGYMTDV